METWRKVWRDGFVPQFSAAGLLALKAALGADDKALLQGATTSPPPLHCVQQWPCEAACPVGLVGWQGECLETVAEVEEFFALACKGADERIGEPAGCRWFLNWWDDTQREIARRELLSEVVLALAGLESRAA